MNSINQKLDILENETAQWNGFNWLISNITRPVLMSFAVFNVAENRVEKRKHFFIFQVINSYYLGITRIMWKNSTNDQITKAILTILALLTSHKNYGSWRNSMGGRYKFFRQQPFDLYLYPNNTILIFFRNTRQPLYETPHITPPWRVTR